jgi:hypothetical protein
MLSGVDELADDPTRVFAATYDQFMLLDLNSGAALWSYVLGNDRERWVSATSNGVAVYVLFRTMGNIGGRLKRIPIQDVSEPQRE